MQSSVRRAEERGVPAGGGGRVVAFDQARGRDRPGAQLVALVAAERQVPPLLLLHPSRCGAAVAEARQIAMYLMHVILQRSYIEVGEFFGRDRTTVSHACAHIEDLRETPAFEAMVDRLEAALAQSGNTENDRAAG